MGETFGLARILEWTGDRAARNKLPGTSYCMPLLLERYLWDGTRLFFWSLIPETSRRVSVIDWKIGIECIGGRNRR